MNEKDKKILLNLLLDYTKKEKKFPKFEKILKYNELYKMIFSNLKKEKDIKELYLSFFKLQILKGWSKFRKEIKKRYEKNNKIFEDFYLMNLKRENLKNPLFHEIWEEFLEKLDLEWLKNIVLWSMENWKFKQFSSSTASKIDNLILEIFPYFNQIWVITK